MIDLEDFDSEDDEFGQADVDDWDEEDFGLSENDSEEQDCLADDLSQTYGVIDGYHTWEYEPAKPLPTPPPPPPKPLPPPPPPHPCCKPVKTGGIAPINVIDNSRAPGYSSCPIPAWMQHQ